jgi:hypothetical protein
VVLSIAQKKSKVDHAWKMMELILLVLRRSVGMCGWITVAAKQLTGDVALAGLTTSEKTRAKTRV